MAEEVKKNLPIDSKGKPPSMNLISAVRIVEEKKKEELPAAVEKVLMSAYKQGYIVPIMRSTKRKSARWLRTDPRR